MRRAFAALGKTVALALILALAGCRYEATLDIAADGSGHGTIAIFDPPPGTTVADAERQLRRAGFAVARATATSPGRIDADISWQDFDAVFRRRVVDPAGPVTLDFGPIDQGRLSVRVPGRIDRGDTSGEVPAPDITVFTRGRAHLTYTIPSRWPWFALGAVLLLTIAGLAAWLTRRTRLPDLDSRPAADRIPS